jgi:hypothetical protein
MDQFEADNSILVSHAKDYPEISSAPASENARAFQIQRSPTILFNPIWEPEADTSEANDAALGNDLGDVPTNSVYHSSIHTSPLLTELTASPYPTASRDDCVRPVTSSEETFQLTIEDSTEESDVSLPPSRL